MVLTINDDARIIVHGICTAGPDIHEYFLLAQLKKLDFNSLSTWHVQNLKILHHTLVQETKVFVQFN